MELLVTIIFWAAAFGLGLVLAQIILPIILGLLILCIGAIITVFAGIVDVFTAFFGSKQ